MIGKVSVFAVKPNEVKELVFASENQIQADSRELLARLMSGDDSARVNTIYIEFENVATPETEAAVTAFSPEEGAEHFTNLSGNCDFVRQTLQIAPEVDGSSITYSGMFADGYGEHGLQFGGDGVNSRVYGMALVSAGADQTQDKVFARKNWDIQKVKNGDLLYVTWTISFE